MPDVAMISCTLRFYERNRMLSNISSRDLLIFIPEKKFQQQEQIKRNKSHMHGSRLSFILKVILALCYRGVKCDIWTSLKLSLPNLTKPRNPLSPELFDKIQRFDHSNETYR